MAKEEERMIYEHRVYTVEPGKMEALHRRFATRTIALFEKHGMKVIGFWEPEGRQDDELVYMLGFHSEEQMEKAWREFAEDPEWKAAASAARSAATVVSTSRASCSR